MYETTGVPGWIRFGTSPGFAGRGAGRGLCAQYIEKTGQMNDFLKDLAINNPNWKAWQESNQIDPELNTKAQKDFLANRISDLEEELKELKNKLKNFR